LKEVLKTRDAGQKEYAHDIDNVFANFERSSSLLDIPRDKALMVFLLKHIDGISAHVKGHTSQREDVTGRITDAIVYLCLLRGMIEDGKNRSERNIVRTV
jgi:antirestriction protein ArdC